MKYGNAFFQENYPQYPLKRVPPAFPLLRGSTNLYYSRELILITIDLLSPFVDVVAHINVNFSHFPFP